MKEIVCKDINTDLTYELSDETVIVKVDPATLRKKISKQKINKVYVAPNKASKDSVIKRLKDPNAKVIDVSLSKTIDSFSDDDNFSFKDFIEPKSVEEKYLLSLDDSEHITSLIHIDDTCKDFNSDLTEEHQINAIVEQDIYGEETNIFSIDDEITADPTLFTEGKSKRDTSQLNQSEDHINMAIDDVLKSNMSVKRAAHLHGIKYNVLVSKIKKVGSSSKGVQGADPALNEKEEMSLVEWIRYRYKSGFPVKKIDLINRVADIVSDGRPTRFKNGVPGEKWYINFLNRNPSVSTIGPYKRFMARESPSRQSLLAWFDRCFKHLEAFKQQHLMEDPKRIGCVEELTLCLMSSQTKVASGENTGRGKKENYYYFPHEKFGNVKILLGACADGTMIPPMPVFACRKPPPTLINTIPSGWGIGLSKDGNINKEVIQCYFQNILIPLLTEFDRLPFILFIDKLKPNLAIETADFCAKKGLLIYNFHPNSNEILQPLFKSVLDPIKRSWAAMSVHENEKAALLRFCPNLSSLLKKINPSSIKENFKSCGIYPFNRKAPDYNKCQYLNQESGNKVFSGSDYATALEVFEDIIGKVKTEIFRETRKGFKLLKAEESSLYKTWFKMITKVDVTASSAETEEYKHERVLRGVRRKLPKPDTYLMVLDSKNPMDEVCNFSSLDQNTSLSAKDQLTSQEENEEEEIDLDNPESMIKYLDEVAPKHQDKHRFPLKGASPMNNFNFSSNEFIISEERKTDRRFKRERITGDLDLDESSSKKLKAAIGPKYCNQCYSKNGKLIKCMVCKNFIHFECMMEEEQQIMADLYRDNVEFDYICPNCS